ncbi:MAG: hypothetical protein R3B99_33470, partial [Polyangiales bacterium]
MDVTVLGELLSPKLRVEPLGPSFSVRSAASALHAFHPEYWFVIDRDDWDDEVVESSWKSFPDPNCNNLLIWRRKELESYFLEPEWLMRSAYLTPNASQSSLEAWIEARGSEGVWLAAANRVLVSRRNLVKRTGAGLLKEGDVHGLSKPDVENMLVGAPLLRQLIDTSSVLEEAKIRSAYNEQCELLTGGSFPLRFGEGTWAALMPAKAIFRGVVNKWMRVPDLAKGGKAKLTGRAAERAIAVDLLKNQSAFAPSDLQ